MDNLKKDLSSLDMERMKIAVNKHAGFWQSIKNAFQSPMGKRVTGALGEAAATAAVAASVVGAKKGYEALREKIEKPRLYKNMLELNPQLKNVDQNRVTNMFNTVYNLNRDMAKDPIVAGSFVDRGVSQAEGLSSLYIDPATTKLLMSSKERKEEPVSTSFMRAFESYGPEHSGNKLEDQKTLKRYENMLREEGAQRQFERQKDLEGYKASLR